MRRAIALGTALATAAALGAVAPAAAQQDQPYRTKLFLAASYVAPLSESDQNFQGVVDTVKASEELGWEAGIAGRWNPLLGWELSYLRATQDVEFGGNKIGRVDFEPITFTFEFHLVPTSVVDFWIGPSVAWVRWGDLKVENGSIYKGGTDSAYGATVGLDLGLSEHLAITSAVRYIQASADLEGFKSANVDPLFARLGFAVRF